MNHSNPRTTLAFALCKTLDVLKARLVVRHVQQIMLRSAFLACGKRAHGSLCFPKPLLACCLNTSKSLRSLLIVVYAWYLLPNTNNPPSGCESIHHAAPHLTSSHCTPFSHLVTNLSRINNMTGTSASSYGQIIMILPAYTTVLTFLHTPPR